MTRRARQRPSHRRLRAAFVLALVVILVAGPVSADTTIWIGRPTLQEYLLHSARQAFEQYLQLRQQIAAFNAQIADARRAYFSASAANRQDAGDRFGQLLLEKDLLIAMPSVMAGDGDQGRGIHALLMLANGGNLADGGIPPSAGSAFAQWVADLQLRSGSAFGRLADPVKAGQVLLEAGNSTTYEHYRRLRDQAELDEFEAQANGGIRKLLGQGSVSARALIGTTDASGLDYRVKSLDEMVLRCTYAGKIPIFLFWRGEPPQDITSLLAMNYTVHNGALSQLQDHAVDACPTDSKQAAGFASAPLKEPLTPEMVKRGRAQAHTVPRFPEATVRQGSISPQVQERRDLAGAMRACNEEMGPAVQAARLSRDPSAMREARLRHAQCLSDARSGYAR